jgi:N-acetylglucosaminyldiphosphoundecaprenol N-acetyl-beta-D-mannosaminyltransferase
MSPSATVLGCRIDRLDMRGTVARVEQLVEERTYTQHMAINTAKLVSMRDDDALRDVIAGCELVNADGQGVVWASRLLGDPLPERVAGIDLMHELLALAERRGYEVYFLGARREVLDRALHRLRERYPALRIAGARDGYFDDSEAGGVCAEIRSAAPQIVFVAMSSPRKEYFLGEHGPRLGASFVMGVGGALDVEAGVTRRAPRTWQRLGLEWLYRLLQEPRRMFRRYAVTNARFAWLMARALLARGASPPEGTGALWPKDQGGTDR